MNIVMLTGRLTKEPQTSFTPSGMCIAKFTLAVDRKKDETDFIRITAFDKTAEFVGRYITKGRQIAIQGRIQTGSYEGKNGTVFTTDIIADRVEPLGKQTDTEPRAEAPRTEAPRADAPHFSDIDDDLPF